MGISFSKRHQQNHQHHNNRPQPPPPLPPPSLPQSPRPPTYLLAPNPIEPYNNNNNTFPNFTPQPQPQPNNNYNYYSRPPVNYSTPYINYYNNVPPPQVGGWGQPMITQHPIIHPAPYVDHHHTKKVKNDVNVHKDTITLHFDRNTSVVSFTFDALIDGSITIFYFAKEGPGCKIIPVYPEIPPVKIPFTKGLGQKFVQPSGSGVDLGFFAVDDLSRTIDDVYPLVISAGAEPSTPVDEHSNSKVVATYLHAQISQAVLQQKDGKNFSAKVVKQILWNDGVRYELRDIFGISNSNETTVSEVDAGKECVICLTEVKDTAVLPCRHMCMCSGCAKELRLQSDKCPVCRQPIEKLLEIKVDDEESQIQAQTNGPAVSCV